MSTAPLYRRADIVVVPSKLPEPLGRVAIEAMSFGRPVIASEIGGLPQVVKDQVTGWLIPPGDAAVLAEAIRRIIELDWDFLASRQTQAMENLSAQKAFAKHLRLLFNQSLSEADLFRHALGKLVCK